MSAKKQSTQKKAPAKKTVEPRPFRWSLALYRRPDGKLATAYCSTDGVVVPSMRARVGKAKILRHDVFSGITFKEARAKLIKESGQKDARVASIKKAKSAEKASAKKAKASKEALQRAA